MQMYSQATLELNLIPCHTTTVVLLCRVGNNYTNTVSEFQTLRTKIRWVLFENSVHWLPFLQDNLTTVTSKLWMDVEPRLLLHGCRTWGSSKGKEWKQSCQWQTRKEGWMTFQGGGESRVLTLPGLWLMDCETNGKVTSRCRNRSPTRKFVCSYTQMDRQRET